MTTARKVAWALIAVTAVICGPLLLIVVGNAGSGVAEYITSTTPRAQQLPGHYSYKAEWGASTLTLASDQTFTEEIHNRSGLGESLQGQWSSALEQETPEVTFSDLLSVSDDDHGRKQGRSGMHVTKSRLSGQIALKINDDLGQQFYKVK